MNGGDWEIIHVPDKPPVSPDQQPTVNVFAAVIDPKFANALVRKLNQIAPLENYRHVKRVHKKHVESGETQLSIILCLASEANGEFGSMPEDVLDLVKSYQLHAFTTKVCRYPAISKEEWEHQCKIWPTSFHPPTYNIEGIAGFTEDDSRRVFKFMKIALELATSRKGKVFNAAVIVVPSSNQIISSAYDGTSTWDTPPSQGSFRSSSRRKVDAFASCPLANGSCSPMKQHSNFASIDPQSATVSCVNPWGWCQEQHYSQSYWHPLRHAAMVAIEDSAIRDMQLFPDLKSADKYIWSCAVQVSAPSLPKKQKTDSAQVIVEENGKSKCIDSEADRPYLCTGYDMYLAWEPCVMCAMAIVHQRVRRVFYAFPNPTAGALGSVHRLQGEKSLNHHYAVFRVMLPDKALGRTEVPIMETTEY
ncbi:hypothetical protein Droror1_Dr00011411 [Drosera rotundifolia]